MKNRSPFLGWLEVRFLRAPVRPTSARIMVPLTFSGHIDRQHLRDTIVAASPRISLPSDGWFGVAGEQFPAGCEAEWRKGHGRIARSGMGRHKTRRCAVGSQEFSY